MKQQWMFCNGEGNVGEGRASALPGTLMPRPNRTENSPSRRALIAGVALSATGWLAVRKSALTQTVFSGAGHGTKGDILIFVFLRGGMDGLNAVIPHGEDEYYRRRPTIGLAPPNDRRAEASERAIDLDGFFGLHPKLSMLKPIYDRGDLALVHAAGSWDQTRSHFEAMATVERGQGGKPEGAADGWVARHLASSDTGNASPLRAVAISNLMPDSLRGATSALALASLSEFRLAFSGDNGPRLRKALDSLYAEGMDAVREAGRETLSVLDAVRRLDPDRYAPARGAVYPAGELGTAMKQVACLIKGEVGLEAACLDLGGWDTHVAQGRGAGWFATQAAELGGALAALDTDLGPAMRRVTVIAMSEFGRRLQENSGLGTDHGRGGAVFLMGGGVRGGKVHGRWPGLRRGDLEDEIDLKVATDYRDILAEIVRMRLRNDRTHEIFPGHTPKSLGLFDHV